MLQTFCVLSRIVVKSVSHPFSLDSPLSFAGGKHYQKMTIPILDLFFKILLFQVVFVILFSVAIFSSYTLQVGLLLQYVALFFVMELVKCFESL